MGFMDKLKALFKKKDNAGEKKACGCGCGGKPKAAEPASYASQFSGGTYIRTDPEIGEYLAGMCAPYGTKITPNDDGTLSCSW